MLLLDLLITRTGVSRMWDHFTLCVISTLVHFIKPWDFNYTFSIMSYYVISDTLPTKKTSRSFRINTSSVNRILYLLVPLLCRSLTRFFFITFIFLTVHVSRTLPFVVSDKLHSSLHLYFFIVYYSIYSIHL